MDAVPVGNRVAPAGFSAALDQRCRVAAKPSSPGARRVASEPERSWRSSEMWSLVMGERVGRVGSASDPMFSYGYLVAGEWGSSYGLLYLFEFDGDRSVRNFLVLVETENRNR